ncbi:MAG: TetR/AcrR family transcriptional regulator [Phycisphaera sp.]|nr:TetR/AcrR family transcriptional regulator [Phycisphaera sp.]
MTGVNRDPAALRQRHKSADAARAMIVDAAVAFLWDRPFRELKAGELMKDTGLSRPAFYQYFNSVHDLILQLLVELGTEMMQVASPWLTTDDERSEALRCSLGGIVEVCVRRGPVFRAIVEAAPLDEDLEAAWSGFMQGWDDAVSDRIRLEQAQGLIMDDLDADAIAHALNRLDATLLVDGFGRRPQADPDQTLDTLLTIWSRTLYRDH